MSTKVYPYIGVTGFMHRAEVSNILEHYSSIGHKLMVGVLASSKTIQGKPNKWPGRYPKMEDLRHIFLPHDRVLNLIHFATDEAQNLFSHLVYLDMKAGPHINGFQLNVAWPSVMEIEDYQRYIGSKRCIVLQLSSRSMSDLNNNPLAIARRLAQYASVIDYVLVDPSGGLGQLFNPEMAIDILRAIEECCYPFRLGIAGGFGPGNLNHLRPVAEVFEGLSIDAEGRLRTPHPEDRLDLRRAREYVVEATNILKQ